jgi:uncharacterized protein
MMERTALHDQMTDLAQIVRDAGGEIVGRTRLQKTVYLLTLAGFEKRFRFGYKHYGPFSDDLAEAAEFAAAFDLISERQQPASWGGTYSVFTATEGQPSTHSSQIRLIREAVGADAVLLELAATAAYLAREGKERPWAETARRKPDKAADGRLEFAKALYRRLRHASDGALPEIASL